VKIQVLLFVLLISFISGFAQQQIPLPTPIQQTWQNAELVALFDYDLHVFDGKRSLQQNYMNTPVEDYNIFYPKKLDTDQWIKSAKDAGCKIAILTATHETGFALYQSDVNPYCLKVLKWKEGRGDIVRDFVVSCRKYDIKPGIFIGFRWNAFYGVNDFKVSGEGVIAQNRQKYYNRMCEGMVEELCSRYGELAIVWFDAGAHGPELDGPDVLPIFNKYQKNAIFYHNSQRADIRWGGSETGMVSYPCWGTFPFPYSHSVNEKLIYSNNYQLLKEGDPNGKYYVPAMSDTPLRCYNGGHEWFWEPGDEEHVAPLADLIKMYIGSVGRNSTLIMGLTPDTNGLLPDPDVKRLKEWGAEIKRRFLNPIASISGHGEMIRLKLPHRQKVNQIVLMEEIAKGERVQKFVLEGKTNKGWEKVFEGSSIGHKFIHQFDAIEVSSVRLNILASKGEPQILDMSLHYVDK